MICLLVYIAILTLGSSQLVSTIQDRQHCNEMSFQIFVHIPCCEIRMQDRLTSCFAHQDHVVHYMYMSRLGQATQHPHCGNNGIQKCNVTGSLLILIQCHWRPMIMTVGVCLIWNSNMAFRLHDSKKSDKSETGREKLISVLVCFLGE